MAGESSGLYAAVGMEEAEEDSDTDRERRRRLGEGVGPIGLVYYTYTPGTNQYSSYRVFGIPQSELLIAE